MDDDEADEPAGGLVRKGEQAHRGVLESDPIRNADGEIDSEERPIRGEEPPAFSC